MMKDAISKYPLNARGKYYVDADTCVHHWCCIETAPNNFRMENLTASVFKQPSTPQEEELCRQALEQCPTAAIYDDGEA